MNAVHLSAEIQRLVDGELMHDRRVCLLNELARRPDQWRSLALAFVERQILDESLITSSSGQESHVVGSNRAAGRNVPSHKARGANHLRSDRNRSRLGAFAWSAAVAACLLIGFAIGNWRGQSQRVEPGNLVADNATAPFAELVERSAIATDISAGIPLADALSRAAYPISIDLRREMMKQGYLITELDRLSKVQLPTGQTVEMPVRQVAVTYLGVAAYQ